MAEIGKNVIENLTTAMYENAYTVYREYIQNSADSIDKAIAAGIVNEKDAIIDINIEYNKRRITINDNAMGIPAEIFVKKLTDIADSQKDRTKEKGFRGIGRLAGVGYCDTLIFKSSYKGENVESVIEWDGKKLRDVLADTTQHPSASDFVDDITYSYQNEANMDEHYFEVIMEGVIPESDDLLDKGAVIEYLESVAPIPFATFFLYKSKIYEFCRNNNLKIDEYTIQVNGNQLFKPYKTKIYDGTSGSTKVVDEIKDVEFREFYASNGRRLAWMWFGISKFEQQIKPMNKMRGIRLRKENIQIGDENTLGASPKFFKEPRGNCYFVGEIYAVDSELIPNARRDYFKTNATTKEFEVEVRKVLYNELYKTYHYANQVKKAFQSQTDYERKAVEYDKKVSEAGFVDERDKEKAKKDLETAKEKAEKSVRTIELREQDANENTTLNRVFNEIKESYRPEISNTVISVDSVKQEEKNKKEDKKYLTQNLSKYNKREQKLISKVYSILQAILPKDMADMVVAKIQEELSK